MTADLRIVDAHAHFFSRRFFATLAAELPAPPAPDELDAFLARRVPFEIPAADPVGLARRWVGELDRHGIARSVLIASVPGDEESVAAAARAFPERFIPYFLLDPRAPDAVDRTRRAFTSLGFRGVCLFPAMHRFHIGDDAVRPVLELARAHRAVVFVHCGHLKIGIRDRLGLPSRFDMRYASPVDLHAVAGELDDVAFVVPHFGCGYFRELLLVADQRPNVYVDTSSSNAWMRLMPYPLDLEGVFARALDVLGPRRLVFGSDSSFFPRGFRRDILDEQLAVVRRLGVPDEDVRAIFGGNLERLVDGA